MAAIQQIQNLIAQSQPIPPDVQAAALLEAQQQGLSSKALAGVFGVPESMIGDAVSALGLGSQLSPSLGGTLATEVTENGGEGNGLFEILSTGNTLLNAGKNIYEGLQAANAASTAASTASGAYQSPYAINLGGSDAAVIANPTDTFTGGLSSVVGILSGQESKAETAALTVLSAFNPAAALAYRLFDAMDLFGGGGLKETPMTPEEAAKYASESRLATTLQGAGEGAGELILDAVQQAKASGVSSEKIAETLNTRGDLASELIGLTVGSNQMLDEESLAAAQAASQATVAPAATEETVDLTTDTTANELLTGGLGDGSLGDAADLGTVSQDPTVDQATVNDVNETWTYNKATDSFISSTRGDSVPNRGNADLKDGGVYAVTPVLGTDGVMAENVVDTETNEPVGVFSIDINTGLPTITKSVDTSTGDGDTFNTAGDTLNTGETLTVGDTTTGGDVAAGGDDFNTAADTNNTGQVLTVGDTTVVDPVITASTVVTTPTVINGANGVDGVDGINGQDGTDGIDGTDGTDGQDGTDGKDGRDGMIGLFSSIQNTPVTDSLFFEPKFTELDNIPVGMFERFLQATGGR